MVDILKSWQRNNAWRRLPYCKGRWDGPMGRTEYLSDRDYSVIAYRGTDGLWHRGNRETLQRCPMLNHGQHTWTPGQGFSPAVNRKVLADLLARCAQHPSTAWIIEEHQHV